MSNDLLVKLFEHNNWANMQIIQACHALSDEQLDAEPQSATQGSIRSTLLHLVSSQHGYLKTLTLPVEERRRPVELTFEQLEESLHVSGEGLLALLIEESGKFPESTVQTRDDFSVEPWVLIVQIINHATEHREQIKNMMSALGVTSPAIDGWDYGEATKALIPMSQ